ncbi:hypothetical protein BXZ70DRAFT_562625 [Cristinia sonorae]|uniref:Extracellular membrane protein CFEM domain-containing protein n=1 Tax=Cristinia sonorae TaxID=1940300 RepID=A0A8K0XKX5_9AGAR|nr:hypothetical protein BXZ70DRAFT_562625 [Cristinia sonorae]
MLALSLLSVALVAGQASATAIQARTLQARAGVERLFARQAGGFNPNSIPQQCQSTCAGTAQVLSGQGCQTDACLCTSTVNTGFQQCLTCVLSLAPPDPDIISQSQEALAAFEDACAASGFPLTSLTISGATGTPTTTSRGSVTIPSNTAPPNTSVFFSDPNVTPTTDGALKPPPNTRSVITPTSTPATTPINPTTPAVIGGGDGAASGGEKTAVTVSAMVAAGIGAMVMLGL